VREHYTVDVGAAVLEVHGSPRGCAYTLRHGRRTVASVSRTSPSGVATYGVEVASGRDDALILAVTVCLALMSGGVAGATVPFTLPRAGESAMAGPGQHGR
jgi:uncharacterized protein YxjI